MDINFQEYIDKAVDWAIVTAPTLLAGIAVIVIGWWLVGRIQHIMELGLKRANVSKDLIPFLMSLAGVGMKLVVILIGLGIMGWEMGALVGVLAAAGFAVGFALQGSLSNFAAGVIILFFKPYQVDDWVEIDGSFGKVESIQIFNTVIVTPGNKTHIIPNGKVVEGTITNFSKKGITRLELAVNMPYSESFPRIKKIIQDALITVPNVLQDPEPEIGIETFDSHYIQLTVRPYTHPDHFWDVTFQSHEAIKQAFSAHGVMMAYSEGVEMGKIGD
ncbi:MAG: mechanosensitive ion channel family protein [Bacteroidia bacterium]